MERSSASPWISVRRSSAKSCRTSWSSCDDHLEEDLLRGEDLLEARDELLHLGELVQDLLALEPGEALQLHLEDRLRLHLGEAEAGDEPLAGGLAVLRLLDELDDLVDVVERDLEAEQDVLALAGLLELVAGAAGDDVAPVGDEPLEHLLQVQDARLPAVDGEQRHAEAGLHRGVLVEVVQHHLRDGVALQLDDDPHPLARGLVAQVGDALELLLAHELGDVLDELRLVHLVRDLGDDDRLALGLRVDLDRRARAHLDVAAPLLVGGADPVAARG